MPESATSSCRSLPAGRSVTYAQAPETLPTPSSAVPEFADNGLPDDTRQTIGGFYSIWNSVGTSQQMARWTHCGLPSPHWIPNSTHPGVIDIL